MGWTTPRNVVVEWVGDKSKRLDSSVDDVRLAPLMDMVDQVRRLLDWYESEGRDLPWRRVVDPYGIWVSEVMLQQTQVRTVIPYWERWMQRLPTVSDLAGATEAEVLKLWEGLGYYRRARHLQLAARRIVERHGGVFPREWARIVELPGVGRYTAGAIASIAFDQPEPILDGNIMRVLTRYRAWSGDPKAPALNRRLWEEARRWVEAASGSGRPRACSHLNQGLMELGATVCTPTSPGCERCPLSGGCAGYREGKAEAYPTPKAAPAPTPLHYLVIVASCGDVYCVRQRPAEAVNGGLWEFPNLQVEGATSDPGRVAQRFFGSRGWTLSYSQTVRHAITRYKVTQHVYRLRLRAMSTRAKRVGSWKTLAELESLAFGSAHRRMVERLSNEHDSTG